MTAYLRLTGVKHGTIVGGVTAKAHSGAIGVIAADHGLLVPTDPASGLATGKTVHRAFAITKNVDRASPLLYAMLAAGETLSTWQLAVFVPDAATEVLAYSVALTTARITAIEFVYPNQIDLPKPMTEVVRFAYQSIAWTWATGSITASASH